MVRNVVLGRVRDDLDDAQQRALDDALAGIAALALPDLVDMKLGRDLGLRDGGWSFAITNDWTDAEAYRAYDTGEEHNRHRAVLVGLCEQVARVQIEL